MLPDKDILIIGLFTYALGMILVVLLLAHQLELKTQELLILNTKTEHLKGVF